MTRAQAHEILDRWKAGLQSYPQFVINEALWTTGDLDNRVG